MEQPGSHGAWDRYLQQRGGGQRYGPPAVPPEFGGPEQPDRGAPQPYTRQYVAPPPQPQFTPQPQYTAPPGYQPSYPPGPQQPPYQQYAPQPPQPPKRKRHTGRKVFGGLVGLIAVIIVISVAENSGHGATSTLSAGAGTRTQTAAPAAKGASQAPAQTPASAPANTAPAGTTSELQALAAAEDYLSDGQGFSRQGLIGQLDSPDGDNFSVADATWGVEHSDANWDGQAVDSAKGYMSDGEGFSREGLIQQMTSSYGDQFTEAQAEYAANAVGL
jgi:hypothetical protein